MTRRRASKGKHKGSGLGAHARRRKKLIPPLNQLPTPPTPIDWLRDTFPEMLWLCSMVVSHPWGEARDVVVESMQRLLEYRPGPGPVLTGTLSSFETIPAESRPDAIAALRGDGLYKRAFSPEFAQALGMYPSAPGRWVVEPQFKEGLRIDPQTAEGHLSDLIAACVDGRNDESTWSKAVYIARFMVEGKISIPHDMPGIELFTAARSTLDASEVLLLQSMIRSMFLAMWSAESDRSGSSKSEWARTFWQSNYRLFACRPPGSASSGSVSDEETAALGEVWVRRSAETAAAFAAALRTVDPDLYEPDRYEVLVGLATRAIRMALSIASSPDLWRPEVCHPLVRAAVESRITLEWLEKQGKPSIYTEYKDYGRGHLKLYKLQLEEHLGADESRAIDALLDFWQAQVDKDLGEELQEIDVGSFGVNLRQKAIAVGFKKDYDLVFEPACAEVHGEWASLDRLYLVQCTNPLHRGHRLPVLEPTRFLALGGVDMVVRYAYEVARRCCEFLGADLDAVGLSPSDVPPDNEVSA